jgi:hypothetical protein
MSASHQSEDHALFADPTASKRPRDMRHLRNRSAGRQSPIKMERPQAGMQTLASASGQGFGPRCQQFSQPYQVLHCVRKLSDAIHSDLLGFNLAVRRPPFDERFNRFSDAAPQFIYGQRIEFDYRHRGTERSIIPAVSTCRPNGSRKGQAREVLCGWKTSFCISCRKRAKTGGRDNPRFPGAPCSPNKETKPGYTRRHGGLAFLDRPHLKTIQCRAGDARQTCRGQGCRP